MQSIRELLTKYEMFDWNSLEPDRHDGKIDYHNPENSHDEIEN